MGDLFVSNNTFLFLLNFYKFWGVESLEMHAVCVGGGRAGVGRDPRIS